MPVVTHDKPPVAAGIRLSGVRKVFGEAVALQVDELSVEEGELFAVLGPSGSGKTTLLRLIAGLDAPTRGRVFFGGQDITDWEPAERNFAMVFQHYALYPHMTIRENIDFPLRMGRVERARRNERVREAARRLRIEDLLDRFPEQLSGGQQQRCAVARAIARDPSCLLLDEPFSSLDANLRVELRAEVKALQRALRATMIYVTHDQEEALWLADRIAILSEGRICQIGTPSEIIDRPDNVTVARFLGPERMVLVRAQVTGTRATIAGAVFPCPDLGPARQDVFLGFHPSCVKLAPGFLATVISTNAVGSRRRAIVDIDGTSAQILFNSNDAVSEGAVVSFAVEPAEMHFFNVETGKRLHTPEKKLD